LLLPYSALALSKRDSVPLTCEVFNWLLLNPDAFKASFTPGSRGTGIPSGQMTLPSLDMPLASIVDAAYDDLEDGNGGEISLSGDKNGDAASETSEEQS
jgi:hypothetical protein